MAYDQSFILVLSCVKRLQQKLLALAIPTKVLIFSIRVARI